MANDVQKEFAMCIAMGMGNWQAANAVGYLNKHCSRMRRSKGVEEELYSIRSDMIDKTHFTKEFMLSKLFSLMGKMESAKYAAESLEPREQREHIKMALEVGKEINKMLGHYQPHNTQHLRVESSGTELTNLIEKVEKKCKEASEKEITVEQVVD